MRRWIPITIKKDGKVEVEGFDFQGIKCVNDIIYKLIQQNALIESEVKNQGFGDEKPVENVYYIKEG